MNANNLITVSLGSALVLAGGASAGFESFNLGSINGQQGWTAQDSFTTSTTVGNWDQAVMDVNGKRVFRMSNAVTSGTYSSQVFSSRSAQVAGESGSALWNDRGPNGSAPYNPLQYGAYATSNQFYSKVDFRSATGSAQAGLALALSASAKQGSVRMSYVQIADNGSTGFDLKYYETLGDGAFPASATTIASGLSYSSLHSLEMTIDFVDGVTVGNDGKVYGNDVLKIYLNGQLIKTGTTWESYYYKYENITAGTPRLQAVDSMLFRVAGAAAPSTSGQGFYFEDFAIGNSSPIPGPGALALVGIAGLARNPRRRS
jgi:hypothetical protein